MQLWLNAEFTVYIDILRSQMDRGMVGQKQRDGQRLDLSQSHHRVLHKLGATDIVVLQILHAAGIAVPST